MLFRSPYVHRYQVTTTLPFFLFLICSDNLSDQIYFCSDKRHEIIRKCLMSDCDFHALLQTSITNAHPQLIISSIKLLGEGIRCLLHV